MFKEKHRTWRQGALAKQEKCETGAQIYSSKMSVGWHKFSSWTQNKMNNLQIALAHAKVRMYECVWGEEESESSKGPAGGEKCDRIVTHSNKRRAFHAVSAPLFLFYKLNWESLIFIYST